MSRDKSGTQDGVSLRVRKDIHHKARVVAAVEGVSISDLIAGLVGPRLDARYAEAVKTLNRAS